MAENPDWAAAILDGIRDPSALTDDEFMRFAVPARTVLGSLAADARIFGRTKRLVYGAVSNDYAFAPNDVLLRAIDDVARAGGAAMILDTLRRTRPRGVRSFVRETRNLRRFAASCALAELHRDREAAVLIGMTADEYREDGRTPSAVMNELLERLSRPRRPV